MDGRIVAFRLDGSEQKILADNQRYPRSLAVDENAVYWVNAGNDIAQNPEDTYAGAVMRVARP
jgi:hypothetical protein